MIAWVSSAHWKIIHHCGFPCCLVSDYRALSRSHSWIYSMPKTLLRVTKTWQWTWQWKNSRVAIRDLIRKRCHTVNQIKWESEMNRCRRWLIVEQHSVMSVGSLSEYNRNQFCVRPWFMKKLGVDFDTGSALVIWSRIWQQWCIHHLDWCLRSRGGLLSPNTYQPSWLTVNYAAYYSRATNPCAILLQRLFLVDGVTCTRRYVRYLMHTFMR